MLFTYSFYINQQVNGVGLKSNELVRLTETGVVKVRIGRIRIERIGTKSLYE